MADIYERNGELALSFGVTAECVLDVPPLFAKTIATALAEGQSEAQF